MAEPVVSVERFRVMFPEFRGTAYSLTLQMLTAAESRTAAKVWGKQRELGIMYLAAHLLSVAPEGQLARLKKENRVTTYQLELERMRAAITMGSGRVI